MGNSETPANTKILQDTKDLEKARAILLNLYHSYSQNHAGYLIAVGVGGLAIIANWKNFWDSQLYGVFISILLAVLGLALYAVKRMFYWILLSDVVIGLSIDEVETRFSEWFKTDVETYKKKRLQPENEQWRDKRPLTFRLERSAIQYLSNEKDRIKLGSRSSTARFAIFSTRKFLLCYVIFVVVVLGIEFVVQFLPWSSYLSMR